MILGGDEFGRTQGGNNNAYCQDNEISWFDWEGIDDEGRALTAFVRRLVAFRKAHPVVRRTRFLHGNERSENGVKDITWIHPSGHEMTAGHWEDRHARVLGVMLNGQAGDYHTSEGLPADDGVLLILMNAYQDAVPFTLPKVPGGVGWRRLIDTNQPEHAANSGNPAGMKEPYALPGRSLVLFDLVAQPAT
jgi:glycogen operon protein